MVVGTGCRSCCTGEAETNRRERHEEEIVWQTSWGCSSQCCWMTSEFAPCVFYVRSVPHISETGPGI